VNLLISEEVVVISIYKLNLMLDNVQIKVLYRNIVIIVEKVDKLKMNLIRNKGNGKGIKSNTNIQRRIGGTRELYR